ncbi:MAG: PAS domain-containing protein [Halopseudomonas aestusnigri]
MQNSAYQSSLIDTGPVPEDITRLLKIWNDRKPAAGFPLKSEMNPVDYKFFLGRICILEIQQNPLDFIFRLYGSEISAASPEDLCGKSLLEGTPKEVYRRHFGEFESTFEAAIPQVWHVRYQAEESYDYYRLILPFTKDGNPSAKSPYFFLTFCYSTNSPQGTFHTYRDLSDNI